MQVGVFGIGLHLPDDAGVCGENRLPIVEANGLSLLNGVSNGGLPADQVWRAVIQFLVIIGGGDEGAGNGGIFCHIGAMGLDHIAISGVPDHRGNDRLIFSQLGGRELKDEGQRGGQQGQNEKPEQGLSDAFPNFHKTLLSKGGYSAFRYCTISTCVD